MGYRSEVAIKCEEKAYERLMETCKELEFHPDKIYKDDDQYILYWEWIKWYDWFDEPKVIADVLSELDDLCDEPGYGYKFIRIGEETGDEEFETNNYDIELWSIHKIDIPDNLEVVEQ